MSKKKTKKKKKNNKKKKNTSLIDKIFDLFDFNYNFNSFEVVIIILISIIFGIIVGYLITSNRAIELSGNSKLSEFVTVYNKIKKNYYKDVDDDKLIDAAIKGMVNSLDDDHSIFLNESNSKNYNMTNDGEYIGIGITFKYEEDKCTIIDVKKDGPADKAGVKVDDILLKINDVDVTKVYEDNFLENLMKKEGTKIKLTIKRDDKEKNIKMKTSVIEIDSVFSKMLDDKIGYIKIDTFSTKTYKQFRSQLVNLENDDMKSLIIDVRNNTGGNLQQTRQILSMFLNKGTVLYQVKSGNKKTKAYSSSFESRNYNVVVLANEYSASASEVLVSCFKEKYKNAIIVGTKTYGKGTIQKTYSLSDGSNIKYTTNYWLTANGEAVDELGIKPDFEVEQGEDTSKDDQLEFAINKLK